MVRTYYVSFSWKFQNFYKSKTFTYFLSGMPSLKAPLVTCSMVKNHNYNVKNGVFVISSCEAPWSYSFVDKKINAIALFCNGLLFNQTCIWNDCWYFLHLFYILEYVVTICPLSHSKPTLPCFTCTYISSSLVHIH